MNVPERMQSELGDPRSDWWFYLIVGIFVIVAGVLAIGVPILTGLATQAFLGALLLVGAVGHVVHAVKTGGGVGRIILGLAIALLYAWAGVMLILHPWVGLLTLTLVLAVFFLVTGIVKIVAAVEHRNLPHWGWLMAGGVISVILGGLIWAQWPSSALWAIGLIIGIELIYAGWTIVALSIAVHSLPEAPGGRLAEQH